MPNTPKLSNLSIDPKSKLAIRSSSVSRSDAEGNEERYISEKRARQELKQAAEAWLEQDLHFRSSKQLGDFSPGALALMFRSLKLLEEEVWGLGDRDCPSCKGWCEGCCGLPF